jgi:surface carbohydrate biosynthesis protein (TIGR04326 family)
MLSFLPPALEAELVEAYEGEVINARQAAGRVRAKARKSYLDLVASLGTVLHRGNQTWRQALARPGEASRWWYHLTSFKDCESDPAFNRMIALFTIRAVAERLKLLNLVLVSAPWEVAAVLKSRFTVEEQVRGPRPRAGVLWLKGLAARAAFVLRTWRQWLAVRRNCQLPSGPFEVVFSGSWDWSVAWDDQTRALTDRYFKGLPTELTNRGVSRGWLAWFAPQVEPGKQGRSMRAVLAPLSRTQDVVILQAFLRPGEILKATRDLGPLATFLAIRKQPAFRELFQQGGFDYYPLFREGLLYGFLNSGLPYHELLALATERATRRYRPQITVSFLEHFPYARAHHEGVRRAGTRTRRLVVQHASYNHEKTFLFLDPVREFQGQPDGCRAPCPDYVCAMGSFGKELFEECGYPEERVFLTGGTRYDYIREAAASSPRRSEKREIGEEIHLLMVPGLDVDQEMEMVDAVVAATRDLAGISLALRNHPFRRVDDHPGFAPYRGRIELTQVSLEEDLAGADLIMFTYSTVAEEAFLQGIPVWQWLPLGYNGSALAEVAVIPQFSSVAGLKEALQRFQADPEAFLLSGEARRAVLERLFYRGDGQAATRIADLIKNFVSIPQNTIGDW